MRGCRGGVSPCTGLGGSPTSPLQPSEFPSRRRRPPAMETADSGACKESRQRNRARGDTLRSDAAATLRPVWKACRPAHARHPTHAKHPPGSGSHASSGRVLFAFLLACVRPCRSHRSMLPGNAVLLDWGRRRAAARTCPWFHPHPPQEASPLDPFPLRVPLGQVHTERVSRVKRSASSPVTGCSL